MLKKYISKIIILFCLILSCSFYYNVYAGSTILGSVKEDFGDRDFDIPVKGVRINLIDQNSGITYTTVSEENGDFHFYDVPTGVYTIQYKYGDITVLRDFPNENLTAEDVLKYNGHDYSASYMNGVTVDLAKQVVPIIDKDAAQVFFVVDRSGSMSTGIDTATGRTRLQIVQEAAKILIKNIFDADENIYMGLVQFNDEADLLSPLCRDAEYLCDLIDGLTATGNTNITDALALARKNFINNQNPKIIILLSDGVPNKKHEKLKDEIKRVRANGIELFSLFVEDDLKPNQLARLHEYFDESPIGSTKLVFKKTGSELANFMTNYIPTWVIEKIIELRVEYEESFEKPEFEYNVENAIEDPARRNEVDGFYNRLFHYKHSSCEDDMAGLTYLFQSIEDSSNFTQKELEYFSEHTYMTASYTDLNLTKSRVITDLNFKLKRRQPFKMEVETRAVAFKITLSDGTIIKHEIHNEKDFHIFYTSLDNIISLGSVVEIEYEVTIKNTSESIDCSQLELIAYLPREMTLESITPLITQPRTTNYDNGWQIANKEELYEAGYISDSVYNNNELACRDMAVFFLDSTNGLTLEAQNEFVTHFVASVCIGDAEQIPSNSIEDVEILGYTNSKNKRMEFVYKEPEYLDYSSKMILKSHFLSLYPGDGIKEHVDFAEDTNREFIFPATGKQHLILNLIKWLAKIIISIMF